MQSPPSTDLAVSLNGDALMAQSAEAGDLAVPLYGEPDSDQILSTTTDLDQQYGTIDMNQDFVPLFTPFQSADAKLQNELQNNAGSQDSEDEVFEDAAEDWSSVGANGYQTRLNQRPFYELGATSGADFESHRLLSVSAGTENDADLEVDQDQEDQQQCSASLIGQNLDKDFSEGTLRDLSEGGLELEQGSRTDSPKGEGEEESSYPDIFQDSFGQINEEEEDDDDDVDESEVEETDGGAFEAAQQARRAGIHECTRENGRKQRLSTPPPPVGIKPEDAGQFLKKEVARSCMQGKDPRNCKEEGRTREGPDIDRDRSRSLNAHWRFHERAASYIPRLPNHEFFDWSRRYWIAVLLEGKKPMKTTSEKDFLWMKGNKFSTVATVFHAYANATMNDKDALVLLLGNEKVEMMDQMRELDYFSDRLVVMRAVTKDHPDANGKSLIEGLEPVIIELSDD